MWICVDERNLDKEIHLIALSKNSRKGEKWIRNGKVVNIEVLPFACYKPVSYVMSIKHFFSITITHISRYSGLHISSNEVFCKILKKPSIVEKKMILPHMKAKVIFIGKKQNKIFCKKNSKWPTKKKLIFQLRQF